MTNMTYAVDGMHCGSCANKISTALADLDGVSDVQVHLDKGEVTVTTADGILESDLVATITDLGYTAARA